MYKYISISLLCVFISMSALAAGSSKKASGWADADTFCKMTSFGDKQYKDCMYLVDQYQKATVKHFNSLPANQLKKISKSINKLADKNSIRYKQMKDAVNGIGDTLRAPIQIPSGVRRLNAPNQQQYIK